MSLIGGLSIGNVVSIVMLKEFMCITLKMPTLNYTLVKKIPLMHSFEIFYFNFNGSLYLCPCRESGCPIHIIHSLFKILGNSCAFLPTPK